jgi:hypothetical protein
MNGRRNTALSIERQELTDWSVASGGKDIRLGLSNAVGKPSDILLSFDTLSSLLMTLPRMLKAALDARGSDGSLRVAQHLGSWRIERACDDASLVLQLATPNGFEVAFALTGKDAGQLGLALVTLSRMATTFSAGRPH